MKYILTLFSFCLCISASAQLIKKEAPLQLPIYLSLLEINNPKDDYSLKTDLKTYTFSADQLNKMRRGDFFFNPKNINKEFIYAELPTRIELGNELQKIMHKIPGESILGNGAKGFTL